PYTTLFRSSGAARTVADADFAFVDEQRGRVSGHAFVDIVRVGVDQILDRVVTARTVRRCFRFRQRGLQNLEAGLRIDSAAWRLDVREADLVVRRGIAFRVLRRT